MSKKRKILLIALVAVIMLGSVDLLRVLSEGESGEQEEMYMIANSLNDTGESVYVNMKQIEKQIYENSVSTKLCEVEANSELVTTQGVSITKLQEQFPTGMYWNHEGNPNNTDYNSVTNTPCHTTSYSTSCCNTFEGGAQCHGFALLMSSKYHNNVSTYTYGISHNIADMKVGDVVRYRTGSYEHSIFITSISGNTVTYAECNYDLHCGIRWNQKTTKTKLASLIKGRLNSVYNFPNQYSETGFVLSYEKRRITYDINACYITVSDVVRYNGETKPIVTVKNGDTTLKYGIDFDFYINGELYDSGTLTVRGQGMYEGEVQKTYKIVREDLAKCTVEYKKSFVYSGVEQKPTNIKVIDQYGKEVPSSYYEISYDFWKTITPGQYYVDIFASDSQDIFQGDLRLAYVIESADIGMCEVEYDKKIEFKGLDVYPDINVKYKGEMLVEGKDYKVTIANNTDIGVGTISIEGIGDNFKGTKNYLFEIYANDKKVYAY